MSDPYELYYWPMIPGRGEMVRLLFAEAEVDYRDVGQAEGLQSIFPLMYGQGDGAPVYAPPILKHGEIKIGQTAAIMQYVASRHGLAPNNEGERARALQLMLTILDATDEAHDTHHPLGKSKYYEDQKEEAKVAGQAFANDRLPKLLGYFEKVLGHAGGEYLLGELSYPDLALYQLMLGLQFAFPKATAQALTATPRLAAHIGRVGARPKVAAFKASVASVAFNNDGIFRQYPELDLA